MEKRTSPSSERRLMGPVGQGSVAQTMGSCFTRRVGPGADRWARPRGQAGVGSYLRAPAVSAWRPREKVDSGCWGQGDASLREAELKPNPFC